MMLIWRLRPPEMSTPATPSTVSISPPNLLLGNFGQFANGHIAADRQRDYGIAVGVRFLNRGRQNVRRQLPHCPADLLAYVVRRLIDVPLENELRHDVRVAFRDKGAQLVDAADRRHSVLNRQHHLRNHLFRTRPWQLYPDIDGGGIALGKRSTPSWAKLKTPITTRNMMSMNANTGRWTQISERRTVRINCAKRMNCCIPFSRTRSQFAGMGKALAETFPAAKDVFEEADDALGFPISRLCFEGPEEELKLTENTQPALLTVSIAAYRVLETEGLQAPEFVAGHSLGEYSALVAAGSLNFADAVRLVRKRGQYMQEAVPPGVGAMAALLKLPDGKLDAILSRSRARRNGQPGKLELARSGRDRRPCGSSPTRRRSGKGRGRKRAIILPVSAPFHCALMRPAQTRLATDLDATEFRDLRVPLINNWQAEAVTTGADARRGLYEQVPNPVRWSGSMRFLASQGVTDFIEAGAGGVLTGLLRNIDPNLRGFKFGEPIDLEKIRGLSNL